MSEQTAYWVRSESLLDALESGFVPSLRSLPLDCGEVREPYSWVMLPSVILDYHRVIDSFWHREVNKTVAQPHRENPPELPAIEPFKELNRLAFILVSHEVVESALGRPKVFPCTAVSSLLRSASPPPSGTHPSNAPEESKHGGERWPPILWGKRVVIL